MDDDLNAFEAELRRLRPVAPSAETKARVARELARSEPAAGLLRPRPWWVSLPIAAAIAVAAAMLASRDRDPRAREANFEAVALKPVAAENLLYAATDEGLVILDDGTPARRARLRYLDTFVWKNPRTNASLTWRVPREEVRIVPVSFQ